MSIKQVDAVVAIVSGLDGFVNGNTLTDAQRKEAVELITDGLVSGEIQMSTEARARHDNREKMRSYAGGLLNNWLRKSPELNGGTRYVPKNPGARSGGPEYKQALALKKHLEQQGVAIPAELEEFIAANAPTPKAKVKEVDVSALPEHLRTLVG